MLETAHNMLIEIVCLFAFICCCQYQPLKQQSFAFNELSLLKSTVCNLWQGSLSNWSCNL